MRRSLPALCVLLAILAGPIVVARTSPRIVYMDNWPNGAPKLRAVSVRTLDGVYVFDGGYEAYHPDGSLQIEGTYRRGRETGTWRWFDVEGREIARCDYDDGEGAYRAVHGDGSPWWTGTLRRGQRVGTWSELDAAGRPLKQGAYVDGEPDGVWQYFAYDDSGALLEGYQGRWDRGDLLEEDSALVRAPRLRLSWLEHLLGSALSLLWFVAPWPLALRWARDRGLAEALLVASVYAASLWIGLAMLLGSAGLLTRASLAASCALLLAAGLRPGGRAALRARWRQALELVLTPSERALALLGLSVVAISALTLLREPPGNYDSLAYHLPVLADWLQSASLRAQPELGQVAWYAFSFELLALGNLIALRGDATVAWPNLFALGLAWLSIFVVARRAQLPRAASAIGASLFLLAPEILRRLASVQPDLGLAACFAAALALRGRGAAFGCALALLAGSKMSGLGYTLLVLALAGRGAAMPWRVLPCVLLLGGFWLLRNAVLAGNPFGAVQFGPWAGTLDGDALRRGTLWALFAWGNAEHWRVIARALWSVAGAALPLLALSAAWGVRLRRDWTLLAAFVGAGALYALTPYSGDNGQQGHVLSAWMVNNLRFAFPAWMALAMLAVSGLPSRSGPWLLVLLAGALAWAVAEIVAPLYALLLSVAVVAACLLGLRGRARFALGSLALLAALSWSHAAREQRHAARLELYGHAYELCERRLGPSAPIGVLLTERRYPWVGPRLARPIVDATPRAEESYEAWLARLAVVDGLIVGGEATSGFDERTVQRAREWLARAETPFEAVGSYDSQKRDEQLYLRVR